MRSSVKEEMHIFGKPGKNKQEREFRGNAHYCKAIFVDSRRGKFYLVEA